MATDGEKWKSSPTAHYIQFRDSIRVNREYLLYSINFIKTICGWRFLIFFLFPFRLLFFDFLFSFGHFSSEPRRLVSAFLLLVAQTLIDARDTLRWDTNRQFISINTVLTSVLMFPSERIQHEARAASIFRARAQPRSYWMIAKVFHKSCCLRFAASSFIYCFRLFFFFRRCCGAVERCAQREHCRIDKLEGGFPFSAAIFLSLQFINWCFSCSMNATERRATIDLW